MRFLYVTFKIFSTNFNPHWSLAKTRKNLPLGFLTSSIIIKDFHYTTGLTFLIKISVLTKNSLRIHETFQKLLVSIGFSSTILENSLASGGGSAPRTHYKSLWQYFPKLLAQFPRKIRKNNLKNLKKLQKFHENYQKIARFHWFCYSDFQKFASGGGLRPPNPQQMHISKFFVQLFAKTSIKF